jgi:glycosyltransferase involved in cell wall biosynthesis
MVCKSFPIQASVIICTYRRDKVLVETVNQVLAQADSRAEVVIVDQKAQHDLSTHEYLQTKCNEGRIRYFNLEVAGLTHARNFGATQARGAVLLFCDDDVIPSPNWIREHIAMYEDQQVSAVAGQVLNVGEHARDAPGSFDHNQQILIFGTLHGANFSVRKSVYESIGGSDENLGVHAYTEDSILAHRLQKGGHRISYCPSASVVHLMSSVGGCQINDCAQPTKEWEKPFSKLYWLHLNPPREMSQRLRVLWEAVRHGPLRKDAVIRFWRQPAAWSGFVMSYWKARSAARGLQHSARPECRIVNGKENSRSAT